MPRPKHSYKEEVEKLKAQMEVLREERDSARALLETARPDTELVVQAPEQEQEEEVTFVHLRYSGITYAHPDRYAVPRVMEDGRIRYIAHPNAVAQFQPFKPGYSLGVFRTRDPGWIQYLRSRKRGSGPNEDHYLIELPPGAEIRPEMAVKHPDVIPAWAAAMMG